MKICLLKVKKIEKAREKGVQKVPCEGAEKNVGEVFFSFSKWIPQKKVWVV